MTKEKITREEMIADIMEKINALPLEEQIIVSDMILEALAKMRAVQEEK